MFYFISGFHNKQQFFALRTASVGCILSGCV